MCSFPDRDYQSAIENVGLKLFLKLVKSLTKHCCLTHVHVRLLHKNNLHSYMFDPMAYDKGYQTELMPEL